jgi:hypothetical protein
MRRGPYVLLTLGALASSVAVVWQPMVMPELTKLPTSLSGTSVLQGTETIYVNEKTGARVPAGVESPMTVSAKLTSTPGTTSDRVVIHRVVTTTIGDAQPSTQASQYVLDRSTAKTVPGGVEGSWLGSPDNQVDGTGAYVLGPPMGAYAAEYPIWDDTLGKAVPLQSDGTTSDIHGVSVHGFIEDIPPTPVSPTFAAAMKMPLTQPFAAVAARMKASGLDVSGALEGLTPELSSAEQDALSALMKVNVPLNYTSATFGKFLVEPDTGATIEVRQRATTLAVSIDLAPALNILLPVLKAHPDSPAAQQLLPVFSRLTSVPAQPLATVVLRTAPASVEQTAAKVQDHHGSLVLIKALPLALGALGCLLSVSAAILLFLRQRRRQAVAYRRQQAAAAYRGRPDVVARSRPEPEVRRHAAQSSGARWSGWERED